ncbi:MAG: hypothetical protein ACE5DQ_01490, partial [Candidatus Paceibacterota bacterium]
VTTEKADLTLDVEKSTVQRILNTETIKLESTGFSKFKAGDRIHFVIKKPKKDGEKRASAIRIIIIPQEYFTKIDTKKSS